MPLLRCARRPWALKFRSQSRTISLRVSSSPPTKRDPSSLRRPAADLRQYCRSCSTSSASQRALRASPWPSRRGEPRRDGASLAAHLRALGALALQRDARSRVRRAGSAVLGGDPRLAFAKSSGRASLAATMKREARWSTTRLRNFSAQGRLAQRRRGTQAYAQLRSRCWTLGCVETTASRGHSTGLSGTN